MKIFNTNSKSISDHCLMLLFFLLLPLATAYAEAGSGAVSWSAMLAALKDNIQPVIYLIKAVGFVIGFWMIISAIMELKHIGETKGATSTEAGLGGPLVRMALGIALIYYPSTISIAVSTLGGVNGSIMQYTPSGAADPFLSAKQGAILLVQAIGYVSFIRGFVTLSNSTKPGAQQGTVGKGVMYIVGGILAINIVATIQMLGNTLGVTLL